MSEALYALALLACPVGMGLVMWFLVRGMRQPEQTPADVKSKQVELMRLQAEIDQLEAERTHRRSEPAGNHPA
ncbi:hypothetical protein CLV92_10750 [Kineococcus xinjiangensis]|uniref:Uncharacterized protein n=1 Tax=Kineococcus xinjiangensis TaxID=512762 RepID=A0A2S6IJZ1_9ACTN|nr:hypothetical protein [Kineococcus xinjiangensis]PPK94547.1 hypothetical protein CLV92_10750 [Kineococcus xinjiangensis]